MTIPSSSCWCGSFVSCSSGHSVMLLSTTIGTCGGEEVVGEEGEGLQVSDV